VDNFVLVKNLQPTENLVGHFPNIFLFESLLSCVFQFSNFVLKITSVGKLHDNTETLFIGIKVSSMIPNNVRDIDRSE